MADGKLQGVLCDEYISIYTKITEVDLSTKILEVNLFAVAYRLFHRDFSPINGTLQLKFIYICLQAVS